MKGSRRPACAGDGAGGSRWLEEHGGDLLATARRLDRAPREFLDFSASLNPFGPPPGALRATARTLRGGGALSAAAYPPRDGGPVREALAASLGVPPDCCLLANGGAEAIHLLVRAVAPRRLVLFVPCFGEYARAAVAAGVPVVTLPLAPARGFVLGEEETETLGRALGAGDLLFLANPNNPTGRLVPASILARLAALARERDVFLAVDEAFLPLASPAEAGVSPPSLARRAAGEAGLAVVGSLTKLYSIPGLRLGYLVAAPGLVERARALQPSWPLSAPALAAALACLEADADGAFTGRSRALLAQEREWLRRRLARAGTGGHLAASRPATGPDAASRAVLAVYPSEANFLLVQVLAPAQSATRGGVSAGRGAAALAAQGILVRDCSSFPGLGPSFIRVAVLRRRANRRLADALLALLGT